LFAGLLCYLQVRMSRVIEIGVPIEEIEARRRRVEAARRFEEPDRVPVLPAIAHRFLVPQTGTKFRDYYADPEVMLRTQILAQKWLLGNVNPMLIRSGTPGQVREATRRVIEVLAPLRGFVVQDGNNIPPGSPLENINAMMEAAETYGR